MNISKWFFLWPVFTLGSWLPTLFLFQHTGWTYTHEIVAIIPFSVWITYLVRTAFIILFLTAIACSILTIVYYIIEAVQRCRGIGAYAWLVMFIALLGSGFIAETLNTHEVVLRILAGCTGIAFLLTIHYFVEKRCYPSP